MFVFRGVCVAYLSLSTDRPSPGEGGMFNRETSHPENRDGPARGRGDSNLDGRTIRVRPLPGGEAGEGAPLVRGGRGDPKRGMGKKKAWKERKGGGNRKIKREKRERERVVREDVVEGARDDRDPTFSFLVPPPISYKYNGVEFSPIQTARRALPFNGVFSL